MDGSTGEHRFFFIMCIIDVFDRAIIAYHIGLTCEAKHLVQITQEALMKRQAHSARKTSLLYALTMAHSSLAIYLKMLVISYGMIHERIPPKTPNKNAHIESFHSILELECYRRHEFETYPQTYMIVTAIYSILQSKADPRQHL